MSRFNVQKMWDNWNINRDLSVYADDEAIIVAFGEWLLDQAENAPDICRQCGREGDMIVKPCANHPIVQ